MKKTMMFLFIFISSLLIFEFTNNMVLADADGPTNEQFQFNWSVNMPGQAPDDALESALTVDYGNVVTFDVGSLTPTGKAFIGFQMNGKVEMDASKFTDNGIRVTQDTDVDAFFKNIGETVVIFMDANQDFIASYYTDPETDKVVFGEDATPDYLAHPKPGLEALGWTLNGENLIDFDNDRFTEDTVVYIKYDVDSSQTTSLLTVINGDLATGEPANGVYEFNDVATVEADGTGVFQYWLKDGIIASLQPTYSFTMIEDTTVEAVFDDTANYNPDDAFISISAPYGIRDGYNSLVGQFHVPSGHDLIEYGILAADLEGGITFNTPGVEKIRSNKYYPVTNEFMMTFPDSEQSAYRAYMITTDGTTETITYSYMQENNFATDLIISEYGEGSSNNKWIEIYNGTGQDINLANYKLELFSNGSSSGSNTESLTGILVDGESYVIYNSSSIQSIIDLGDISSSVTFFNGDDAVALMTLADEVIDVVGKIGEDPGSNWPVGSDSTENHTLVRNASVLSPTNDWIASEWTAYNVDTIDYLGSHTMNTGVTIFQSSEFPASLSISGDTSVHTGETITLSEAASENVVWYSSDTNTLTIDQDGVVTGEATGTATIYAYSYYSHDIVASYSVECLGARTFDITFEENGGSLVADQTKEGGQTVVEPVDPTKADHLFDGWFTDAGLTESYNFEEPVSNNLTLYAKWIDLTQASDVAAFWDTNPADTDSAILQGVVVITTDTGYILQDPTSAELISIHDSTNTPSIGDEVYLEGTYNVYQEVGYIDLSLYRLMSTGKSINTDTSNAVLIDFDAYNQASYNGILMKVEQPYVDDTGTYIKLANNLNGLASQLYNSNYVGVEISSSDSALLTAFDGADNQQYTSKSVYIFFYDATTTYQKAVVIDASHVVDETTYTVSFNVDGGSAVESQTVIDGNQAVQPTNPTKTGATFAGWYSDSELTTVFNFASSITAETTIYAKWDVVQTWTVTYDSNEGSAVSSETVNDGDLATEPSNPTRDGYTFAGWYTDDTTFNNLFDFTTDTITSSITLYAKWDLQTGTTYIETFDGTDGTGTTSQYLNRTWTTTYQDSSVVNWTSEGIRINEYIDSFAAGFGSNSSNFIKASVINNGITELQFDARHMFNGSSSREVSVYINDTLIKTIDITSSTSATYYVSESDILSAIPGGVSGTFSLEIRNTGGERVVIDNLTWTSNPA